MDELSKQAADLIIGRLSRQAVYDIKKGKYCPSLSLVQKACEVWKVRFSFRGITIDSKSFAAKAERRSPTVETPGDLFEQPDNRSFEVIETKPMGRALEITLRLTLPAQKGAGGR